MGSEPFSQSHDPTTHFPYEYHVWRSSMGPNLHQTVQQLVIHMDTELQDSSSIVYKKINLYIYNRERKKNGLEKKDKSHQPEPQAHDRTTLSQRYYMFQDSSLHKSWENCDTSLPWKRQKKMDTKREE